MIRKPRPGNRKGWMLIRDRIPRPREASTEAAKDSVRFAKDPGHRELWHELSDGFGSNADLPAGSTKWGHPLHHLVYGRE